MARQPPRSKPAPTGPPKGKSAHLVIGELGELLVADWVRSEGGTVLAERWHCVTGELDIVAQLPPGFSGATETLIAFIEVKTRRRGTWDKGGLLAITPQKQNKLWRTAQFFLKKHPQLRTMPCRFDVALVQCQGKPAEPKRKAVTQDKEEGDRQLTIESLNQSPTSPKESPNSSDKQKRLPSEEKQPIKLGEAVVRGEYRLTLQQYVVDAFTL